MRKLYQAADDSKETDRSGRKPADTTPVTPWKGDCRGRKAVDRFFQRPQVPAPDIVCQNPFVTEGALTLRAVRQILIRDERASREDFGERTSGGPRGHSTLLKGIANSSSRGPSRQLGDQGGQVDAPHPVLSFRTTKRRVADERPDVHSVILSMDRCRRRLTSRPNQADPAGLVRRRPYPTPAACVGPVVVSDCVSGIASLPKGSSIDRLPAALEASLPHRTAASADIASFRNGYRLRQS